jgi:hypothetical protein
VASGLGDNPDFLHKIVVLKDKSNTVITIKLLDFVHRPDFYKHAMASPVERQAFVFL